MPKMTSEIARSFVERIEALNDQIEAVYAEARSYEGVNNDRPIKDAVDLRKSYRDARDEAEGLIGSYDWEEPQ